MTKVLFVNVDTQNDFMRYSYVMNGVPLKGKLVVPGAESIEPNLAIITQLAQQYGVKVLNTADSHQHDSPELSKTPDFQQTFPEHCMIATPGALYVPATDPTIHPDELYVIDWRHQALDRNLVNERRNIVATKNAFNVFDGKNGSPHIEQIVDVVRPDAVVVYGVAANVCVNFAIHGFSQRGFNISEVGGRHRLYAVTDATKALNPDPNAANPLHSLEQTLGSWEAAGAKLLTTRELVAYVGNDMKR